VPPAGLEEGMSVSAPSMARGAGRGIG